MMSDYSLDFIGLQETMKSDYDQSFFQKIDPGNKFFWKWVPSVGKSGGILCGVKTNSLDVNPVKIGRFMLQFVLWDKIKKCNWGLIVVYGAAHDDLKMDFLTELAAFCHGMHCPYTVGGDFNIL
jgi:hypothetical protein